MSSRREFLKIMGSSAVVLAAGSLGGCAQGGQPRAAVVPWSRAGSGDFADPRMRALSYAILAPNPHNRQPWQVDLSVPNEVTLYCDPSRLLPETDPFDRQILIGLGCFLEVLRMAAAEGGMVAETFPFPQGVPGDRLDLRPIARIRFVRSTTVAPDPLFLQVLDRRSLKLPSDTSRVVSDETLSQIAEVVSWAVEVGYTNESGEVSGLRELSWRAYLVETTTARTHMESIRLFRIGRREMDANPDGINLGGSFIEFASFVGILTREKMADPNSTAFKQGLDMVEEMLRTGMAYLWVSTDGNSRQQQLDAGTAWVRANLKATELGVGIQPLSQSLQEYPEMNERYEEIHALLAQPGERIQMFSRLGYGPTQDASPRWPLQSRTLVQ
jgi:hypothetical protein